MRNHGIPILIVLALLSAASASAQDTAPDKRPLDIQVRTYLDHHRGEWRDMNVPESDGKALHDIIVKNGYKRAVEIGTSTGYSGIWIAWALSKTGGKLITLEIDARRHAQALEHFRKAGLDSFIDARLGDAHQLVPELKGTFDFVFSDADKEWYPEYFRALLPKLEPGGCFTAHNVLHTRQPGISEFLDLVNRQPDFETTIVRSGGSGLSVSYRHLSGNNR